MTRLIHGESRTRLYQCWLDMKIRAKKREGCYVFPEWEDYVPFASWARANGYTDNMVLCRTNDTGDYEPSNVRWDTKTSNKVEYQAKNWQFLYDGELVEIHNLAEFCRDNNLHRATMSHLSKGIRGYKSHQGYTRYEGGSDV